MIGCVHISDITKVMLSAQSLCFKRVVNKLNYAEANTRYVGVILLCHPDRRTNQTHSGEPESQQQLQPQSYCILNEKYTQEIGFGFHVRK